MAKKTTKKTTKTARVFQTSECATAVAELELLAKADGMSKVGRKAVRAALKLVRKADGVIRREANGGAAREAKRAKLAEKLAKIKAQLKAI